MFEQIQNMIKPDKSTTDTAGHQNSYTTVIHFNELFMKPDSENRHSLAKHIRLISAKESFLIDVNEILRSVNYDEYSLERQFYKKSAIHKDIIGAFEIVRENEVVAYIPRRTDPYCDMILFLCLFINRGSYINSTCTTKDPKLNEIIIYKKKQYQIKNSVGPKEKSKRLSLAKIAACKPQVITYLCHLNCARFIVNLDFLGNIPKSMQHLFFAGVVPKTKSYQSLLYYCYLFSFLWFRKVLKYPENDIEKEKVEDFVRTCYSGYLDNIERLIILHSLKLIDNGVPSKFVNAITRKSKLCWKSLDLFDSNRNLFLNILQVVPDWLSFNQQLKWIRNHYKESLDIEVKKSETSLRKYNSNTSLTNILKTQDVYNSD